MPAAGRDASAGEALHGLFMEVFALRDALAAVMDWAHSQSGLSSAQHRVLHVLEGEGKATVPDVAFRLGVTRQHVQLVCNELLEKGFVIRHDNPRHRRSSLFAVSEAGRQGLLASRDAEFALIEGVAPGTDCARVAAATALLRELRQGAERMSGHTSGA
ncbi:MarR family winged helix-turn-helix transcriptional regulator [Megalodesulfovibrio paquesii]